MSGVSSLNCAFDNVHLVQMVSSLYISSNQICFQVYTIHLSLIEAQTQFITNDARYKRDLHKFGLFQSLTLADVFTYTMPKIMQSLYVW